jgi:phage terminase small subunit
MKPEFEPPQHLSEESQAIWRDIVPRRARSTGRLVLIRSALEARDRAEQARLAIEKTSLTTTTKSTGAVHVHPLVKVEREARQQFARIWETLHLGYDQAEDGGDFDRWKAKQVAAACEGDE